KRNDNDTAKYINVIIDYLVYCLRNEQSVMMFSRDSGLNNKISRTVADLSNDRFDDAYENLKIYFADPARIETVFTAIKNTLRQLQDNATELCINAVRSIDSIPPLSSNPVDRYMYADFKAAADHKYKCGSVTTRVAQTETPAYNKAFITFLDKNPGYPAPDSEIIEAAKALEKLLNTEYILNRLRTNMFMLAMMVKIYSYIEEYRVENNALLLSDTNSLLRTIIGEDDTPFIYERLGVILNHYLIDEFQDTSTIQWECIKPLVTTGVGNGDDSLIIGDEKQCIYRFRNSDPSLLAEKVAKQISDNRIVGSDPGKNTNYRSSRDIVEFNNALFATIAEQNGFSDIYSNVNPRIAPKHANHKGYIKITPLEAADTDEYFATMLPKLADDIQRQLRSGYRPNDIAVLVRKKSDGHKIISYLIANQEEFEHKFNIISDDLMPVSDSPAVRLIISTLRNIAYPFTAPTNARFKTLKETKSLISRFEIALHSEDNPSQALRKALMGKDYDTSQITGTTIVDIVEDIIATLPDELVKLHTPYICAFHDLIADYTTFGLNDLQSFLRWWDDTGKRKIISAPEDPNAIRIMTIHKSKGLQFKCVHLPACTWDVLSFESLSWFDAKPLKQLNLGCELPDIVPMKPESGLRNTPLAEEYATMCNELILDEMNVLYVAFTRAVDELTAYYSIRNRQNLPVAELIDKAMQEKFAGNLIDGEYIFGEPTECKHTEKDKESSVKSVLMADYHTVAIPEDKEIWTIDNTPGEL
ncbi:MAG: UvrD-helicase domain-containing protein, partial [Paramuribaculum sp.]|nr:UvrD-helicase domain-containing protein [Paramuribaculum sp.]